MCVDTLFRFMSTITCLEKINEIKRQASSEREFMARIDSDIKGSSVIADWGHKRTYIIDDVDFKVNPVSKKFEHNGAEISVAQYMQEVYDKTVRDVN